MAVRRLPLLRRSSENLLEIGPLPRVLHVLPDFSRGLVKIIPFWYLFQMHVNLDALQIERWQIKRLTPSASNPRTHSAEQLAQIAASIREFGFVNPVLVAPDGEIIAGEGRLRAAQTLGMRQVPVIVLAHLSKAQRCALSVADNRIPLSAGWDDDLLREQLAALQSEGFNLDLLGFDDQELARRLGEMEAADLTDENEVPDVPAAPVSRRGDLWLLGPGKRQAQSRVLCGDATDSQDVTRLLVSKQPLVLMVTDPPYGVGLDPRWREEIGLNPRTIQGGKVANDDRADWSAAWKLFPGDVIYVWHAGLHAAEVALGSQSSAVRRSSMLSNAHDCSSQPIPYASTCSRIAKKVAMRSVDTLAGDSGMNASKLKPSGIFS